MAEVEYDLHQQPTTRGSVYRSAVCIIISCNHVRYMMELESRNSRELEEARMDVNNELQPLPEWVALQAEIEKAQRDYKGENCD